MAKHRRHDDTDFTEIGTVDDLPDCVKAMAGSHFETGVLEKIQWDIDSKSRTKHLKNTLYYVVNRDAGAVNAFALVHTEKDSNDMLYGWIDFVMVKEENRTEGIGSMLTETAIVFLMEEMRCVSLSTTLMLPVTMDGEVGYPEYGSERQLEEWGFVGHPARGKFRHMTIGDTRYRKTVFTMT